MRLLAAMGVFLFHLWNNYLKAPFVHPGTDFFLITVGVVAVISQSSYIATKRWSTYIWEKYFRLYVTFIPVFVMYLLARLNSINLGFALKSFFFIPVSNGLLPLVPQTWMISNFIVFYCLFSIVFVIRNQKILIPVFTLWAIGCAFNALTDFSSTRHSEIYGVIFDIRNIEFIFGYVVGKIIHTHLHRVTLKAAGYMALIGLIVVGWSTVYYSAVVGQMSGSVRVFMYGLPLSFILVGVTTLEQRRSRNLLIRFLLHPWLVWMGNTSYVLFLIHGIALRAWDTVVSPIMLWQTPILIVVVLFSSALVYQFWEKPMLAYIRWKTLGKIATPK